MKRDSGLNLSYEINISREPEGLFRKSDPIARLELRSVRHKTSKEALAAFEKAVCEWLATPKGRKIFEDAHEDFNYGDLSGYETERKLTDLMWKHGIETWRIEQFTCEDLGHTWDHIFRPATKGKKSAPVAQ